LIRASYIDISSRIEAREENKKLEAQLRQAQKMEAIGTLAGGIAHDFNNLLQVINGYTDLVLSDLSPDQPGYNSLSEVARAGNRATELVGQLLAFSRRQVLKPENLDMNEIVANLLKMLKRILGEHILLDFAPAQNLGRIYADPNMIAQILMNLCINARDAMSEGGSLMVETENVVVNGKYCNTHPWASPGRYILVSVTDTGCGMDAETIGRIFEPFFTTKALGHGTGLGLAMVYGIVKQHNGMIHAYSEPGKGTSFKVYLPTSERMAGEVGSKIESRVEGGHETILLAEDEEMVRNLAAAILEKAGYTVLQAANGEEAMVRFRKAAPEIDLLLLDVVMPGLGGRALYEQARALKPEIAVLFASGYSDNAVRANFALGKGLPLLSKPFSREELLAAVREVLDATKNGAGQEPAQ
jgi:nitrogen-specific signal transduction histidine kinase/ActR/RegA family two-component response regulator